MMNEHTTYIAGIPWRATAAPTLVVSQKCWAYDKKNKKLFKDVVEGFKATIWKNEDTSIAVLDGYVLSRLNTSNASCSWPPEWVYASEEQAKEATTFLPMAFPAVMWKGAIGLGPSFGIDLRDQEHAAHRDAIGERINYDEDCDLGPCCSTISSIRDILYDACNNNGMTVQDKNSLSMLLKSHEPCDDSPCLDNILSSVGLTWK